MSMQYIVAMTMLATAAAEMSAHLASRFEADTPGRDGFDGAWITVQ